MCLREINNFMFHGSSNTLHIGPDSSWSAYNSYWAHLPPSRRLVCYCSPYGQFHSKICSYAFVCLHTKLPADSEIQTCSRHSAIHSPPFVHSPFTLWSPPKCVWDLPKFHFISWPSASQIIISIWSRVKWCIQPGLCSINYLFRTTPNRLHLDYTMLLQSIHPLDK